MLISQTFSNYIYIQHLKLSKSKILEKTIISGEVLIPIYFRKIEAWKIWQEIQLKKKRYDKKPKYFLQTMFPVYQLSYLLITSHELTLTLLLKFLKSGNSILSRSWNNNRNKPCRIAMSKHSVPNESSPSLVTTTPNLNITQMEFQLWTYW